MPLQNNSLIGFIGLGKMGFPMAARLHAAGHRLLVRDALADAAQRFALAHGGTNVAGEMSDFGACSVVITMLPDSSVVELVVLGSATQAGLAPALRAGTCVIDMSSSEPRRTQALAQALAQRQLRFLDAPVSGGVKRAVDGSLAIMVGGEVADVHAQHGLLGCMGKGITHVGAVGAGHAMKALNNYVSAAALVATVEALHIGARFGLDPAVMTDVLNSATGKNNTTENKVKPCMLSGAFDSGFAMDLMAKDVGIAVALGQAIGTVMPLGAEVADLWRRASQALGPGADHTAMFRFLQAATESACRRATSLP